MNTATLDKKYPPVRSNKKPKKTAGQIASYDAPLPDTRAEAERVGDVILSWQREDGAFVFEPDGRHYVKDDFVVARSFIEPMGHAGDPALDLCVLPAIKLMQLGERYGIDRFMLGARRTLDYCLTMIRPEGGDYWECPLHSPNLFAGGHAANAYTMAWRAFGDERYHAAARYDAVNQGLNLPVPQRRFIDMQILPGENIRILHCFHALISSASRLMSFKFALPSVPVFLPVFQSGQAYRPVPWCSLLFVFSAFIGDEKARP